ncbi:hypothetical protein Q7P37_009648 [Cladosporium fusiforme]
MRLISAIPLGWMLLSSSIFAAVLPNTHAALSERSAAPDLGSVRNAFDDALSKVFNKEEKEKVKAALRVGVDRVADEDRQPREGIDNGLSKILNKDEVEKVNGALDIAVDKAKEIISRSIAKEPSVSARDVSTDKDTNNQPPPKSKSLAPPGCDCRLPLNRITFVNDLNANKSDSPTVLCFKYCVSATSVALADVPTSILQKKQLEILIKKLQNMLTFSARFNKYKAASKPNPDNGKRAPEDETHPDEPVADAVKTDSPSLHKRDQPEYLKPFNYTIVIKEGACDCNEVGREIANQFKGRKKRFSSMHMLFWKRRNNPCFQACTNRAREWVKEHESSAPELEEATDDLTDEDVPTYYADEDDTRPAGIPSLSKRDEVSWVLRSFNRTLNINGAPCDCLEVGRQIGRQLAGSKKEKDGYRNLFEEGRGDACFVACTDSAREYVKEKDLLVAPAVVKDGYMGPDSPVPQASSKGIKAEKMEAKASSVPRPADTKAGEEVPADSHPSTSPASKPEVSPLVKRKWTPSYHATDDPPTTNADVDPPNPNNTPLQRPPPEANQEDLAPAEQPQPLPLPPMAPAHPGVNHNPYWLRTYNQRFSTSGPEDDCNRLFWILQRWSYYEPDFSYWHFRAWRKDHKDLIVQCAAEKQIPRPGRPLPPPSEMTFNVPAIDKEHEDGNHNTVGNSDGPKNLFDIPPEPKPKSPDRLVFESRMRERKRFSSWAETFGAPLHCGELFEVNQLARKIFAVPQGAEGEDVLGKKYYRVWRRRNLDRLRFCKSKAEPKEIWGDVEPGHE